MVPWPFCLHHAAYLTILESGELIIGGGFREVRDDRVIVLADSAERAKEIDVADAETARQRAARLQQLLPSFTAL